MELNLEPVKVDLQIENPSLERGAFYSLCFITENDEAPRTLKVTRLQDLLDNGYSRLDLAYNFCVGVFSQQGMDAVYIRAKRSYESYVEAYNSDDNSMYYFVVLQTKDLTEVEKFNKHLVSFDEMKLQFFSQNVGSKIFRSPKLVNYYQDYALSDEVSVESKDYYLNKVYSGITVVNKIPLPDYLLGGYGNTAVDYVIQNLKTEPDVNKMPLPDYLLGGYGNTAVDYVIQNLKTEPDVNKMPLPDYLLEGYGNTAVDFGMRVAVGEDYNWEIDKPNRQVKYARSVIESGWLGSREDSTINNSEVNVVATKGTSGKLLKASIIDPKVKIETISSQLLKGLGKEVLDYAIPLINPEATDWVLDPESNAVKYTAIDGNADVGSAICTFTSNGTVWTADKVCQSNRGANSYAVDIAASGRPVCNTGDVQGWVCVPPSSEVYIPIDTVSQQVIDNAESGHLESQTFLKSIPLFAYLLTGSGTEAVNKVVLDIDPEATDWVLDPANNSIVYTENVTREVLDQVSCEYKAKQQNKTGTITSSTAVSDSSGITFVSCYNDGVYWDAFAQGQLDNVIEVETVEKYLPIDTVAAKVIANAEAGHVPSQEALRLSTVERVNIREYDEALEAASTEIDTSWSYLPIYDVAVQVKRNSIAGHAESIEAVNNSLPFELPDNDTPWAYVPEETSVTGSTTTIKAERTFENQKLKSSITVAASASKVGESLINGGGSDALAYAVPQLIGEDIDWVLDPDNNRIKYTETSMGGGTYVASHIRSGTKNFPSLTDAATTMCSQGDLTYSYHQWSEVNDWWFVYSRTPSGDKLCGNVKLTGETPVTEDKYIPINTVAEKVIANAESGHTPSQEAVKATALGGFTAGEHDADLDAAAVIDN